MVINTVVFLFLNTHVPPMWDVLCKKQCGSKDRYGNLILNRCRLILKELVLKRCCDFKK